jgi:hypothetical protein
VSHIMFKHATVCGSLRLSVLCATVQSFSGGKIHSYQVWFSLLFSSFFIKICVAISQNRFVFWHHINIPWKPHLPVLHIISHTAVFLRSRDSVVGMTTSYGLDDRGVRVQVPVGSRIFSSPHCPDRLWGPPNLLSNWYQGLFPRG